MPKTMLKNTKRKRLSVILHSGDYDRIHYAFVIAATAAAINRPVTLLFTKSAVRALTPDWATKMDIAFSKTGMAKLSEMINACTELAVSFKICELGLISEGLGMKDLRTNVCLEPDGITSFLIEAENEMAQILFV